MGKKLILFKNQSEADGYSSHTDHPYGELLGKTGITETKLRPSGMILVDGKRFSAVADGEFMDENTPVRVIRTEGNRIVVRKGEE
jgi:membrane-bound serine protease (ClpP class)